MIELKNISYDVFDDETKKSKSILKNLNIKFPKNKVTVITGQNGSGKSTLVKLLMGILSPTSGKILYNGKDITNLPIEKRANIGFTIAFQQPVRFKGLTVGDLLDLASKQNNKLSQACDYLAQVGLCARNYVKRELDSTLSGGELKRIELAMALAKGGDILLFDEPEAGIDLWSFDSLVSLFKNLKDKTVIIVSHQKKILENADYILLLSSDSDAVIGEKDEMLKRLTTSQKCGKLEGENNG